MTIWYGNEMLDADEYIKRLQIKNLRASNKRLKNEWWMRLLFMFIGILITIGILELKSQLLGEQSEDKDQVKQVPASTLGIHPTTIQNDSTIVL